LIEHWNTYFTEKGITHIFFSAILEQAKLDEPEEDDDTSDEDYGSEEEEKEFDPMFQDLKEKIDIENELGLNKPEHLEQKPIVEEEIELEFNTCEIFSRDKMM